MQFQWLLPICCVNLLLVAASASVQAEACTDLSCHPGPFADEPSYLLQTSAPIARHGGGADDVQCNGDNSIPQGSDSGGYCAGNQCCPEYNWTFPCPSASDAFKVSNRCLLPEMQVWPTGETYAVPPDNPVPAVLGAYQPVSTGSTETSVADYLKSVPGIADAVELHEGEPGYSAAFHPPSVQDDDYYVNSSYPSLFGDLGSVMQPGFGGIMTYSVFNLTPSVSGPIQLYRVTSWETDLSYMCGIWWGFQSTFATDMVQVAKNIAICDTPSAIVRCNITRPITVVVGQGWNIDSNGFMERECMNTDGGVEPADNFVAKQLIEQDYPPPPADVLQVVVPGCQLSGHVASQCTACPLPQEGLEASQDVASFVDSPPDPSACKGRLLRNGDAERRKDHGHGSAIRRHRRNNQHR